MLNTNLTSFLFGPTRYREFGQTVREWRKTEATWRRSRLSACDFDGFASDLVRRMEIAPDRLSPEILQALQGTVLALLLWEDVGELEADWRTIEADPVALLRFRQMLARRRRWANDTARTVEAFSRVLGRMFDALIKALPEPDVQATKESGVSFSVPLIEVIGEPARVIEGLVFAPYEGEALDRQLFARLRSVIERNLLSASALPPTADIRTNVKKVAVPTNRKDVSAAELADQYLGGTPLRALFDVPVAFNIPDETRYEHLFAVAGTGHGKTQLLQYLIHADLLTAQKEQRSVVVIDSQGDLINRLIRLDLFSPDREDGLADRLILIDPADVEFPPSLNLFDAHLERLGQYRPADRERVLNSVVELYETFFSDLLGAELTQKQGVVFKYLARLMLSIPGATIHTLMQLMEDGRPFKDRMAQLEGSARYFFETEFFHPAFAATKKQILRRLWGVLATPSFERMFAQPTNKLDVFKALQDGSILLVNTAKDMLKTEGSQLFGRFFIKLIAQAALERSTIDPTARTPTMVFVDEAQEYFDDTMETILNQGRKYRVGITTVFQALDLITPRLRAVLLANTSVKCAGGVSARDARALAQELHTASEFIESMKRRNESTEFAVWIKNRTHRAVRLSIPLGYMEKQPILTKEEYDGLIALNRERYSGTVGVIEWKSPPATAEVQPVRPVALEEREAEVVRAENVVAERAFIPSGGDGLVRPAPPPPSELGKGGSQHRYVQHFIKGLAEEQGFRAVIEEALGGGQVDVGLHRGDLSIACEISVTSTVKYEVKNLAKCVQAGYTQVWAIAASAKAAKRLEAAARERLSLEEFGRVSFLVTEDIPGTLANLSSGDGAESVIKGYRVKTVRKAVAPKEANNLRAAIMRIIAKAQTPDS